MQSKKEKWDMKKVDPKEFELPETTFSRDIENKVFQGIVLQCLSKIEGISLIEGNFIDSLFGREGTEAAKGIFVEQNEKNHSVFVKIEINIQYGLPIPEKADEIQTFISNEITKLTGLHVSAIHLIFKAIISDEQAKKGSNSPKPSAKEASQRPEENMEEYNEEF